MCKMKCGLSPHVSRLASPLVASLLPAWSPALRPNHVNLDCPASTRSMSRSREGGNRPGPRTAEDILALLVDRSSPDLDVLGYVTVRELQGVARRL